MPYLKYVDADKAKYILEEIHGGICGNHAGPRSLVNKAIRTGYFMAYYAGGRIGARQEVRQMPTIRERPETASRKNDDDNLPVAVCTMGNRHRRPTTYS